MNHSGLMSWSMSSIFSIQRQWRIIDLTICGPRLIMNRVLYFIREECRLGSSWSSRRFHEIFISHARFLCIHLSGDFFLVAQIRSKGIYDWEGKKRLRLWYTSFYQFRSFSYVVSGFWQVRLENRQQKQEPLHNRLTTLKFGMSVSQCRTAFDWRQTCSSPGEANQESDSR